jgi:hypothetical protein
MDDLINLLAIRNLENAELRNGAINARHPEDPFVQLNEICVLSLRIYAMLRTTDLDLRSKVSLKLFSVNNCVN